MRRLIYIGLFFAAALTACQPSNKEVSTDLINIAPADENTLSGKDLPEITFEETAFNFGEILEGDLATFTYKFTNTGDADLLISEVQTSCGCTTAKDWSKAPYSPGEEGSITITFDSDKKPGYNNKTITVLCNTVPSVHKLKMYGDVIGPQQ